MTPAELDFRWHGPMGKGYRDLQRLIKRGEAEERNARTRPERRRAARR